MSDHPTNPAIEREEEDAAVRLLRAAGPRVAVAADRAARVRAAVKAEWQTRNRRRIVRSRVILAAGLAGAAALLVVAIRTPVVERVTPPLGEPVATVEMVEGTQQAVQNGDAIRVGQWIETGPEGRVALRFAGDTSVRIDVASRLRILSASAFELAAGAVYVDSGEQHRSVEIRTPFGTARDLGTQFEVRLVERGLRLRVRTGVVELTDRTRVITGRPGTEITLSDANAETRPMAPDSAEWAWTNRVAPPWEMEGVTLAAFVARVAREQGWTVEYGDASVARGAETILLHGSASTLSAQEAVEVAVATSDLRHRFNGRVLVVFRADQSQPDDGGRRR